MVNVKTAKGRSNSSTKWLSRQINDPFVKQAQKHGYRSRAAYKLIEINEKHQIITPGKRIVDLGSSPGGWSQVAAEIIQHNGAITAIDILPMETIPHVTFIQNDINKFLDEHLPLKADLIISDMAPNCSGNHELDHIRSMNLCEMSFEFAKQHLETGGILLMKILQGGREKEMCQNLKQYFDKVKYIKPKASRKNSSEIYMLAQNFLN